MTTFIGAADKAAFQSVCNRLKIFALVSFRKNGINRNKVYRILIEFFLFKL